MGIFACPVRLRPEQYVPRPRTARPLAERGRLTCTHAPAKEKTCGLQSLGAAIDEPKKGDAPQALLAVSAISPVGSRPPSGPAQVAPHGPPPFTPLNSDLCCNRI